MEALLIILGPTIGVLLSLTIPAAVIWFAAQYHRITGVKLSAEHRAALHSALETGVNAALTRGLSGKAATAFAVSYAVQKGAPDAAQYFAKGKEQVMDFKEVAESKLKEAVDAKDALAKALAVATKGR